MRLNEQRDHLIEACRQAEADLRAMRSAVLRKIASPYGDGSRSDQINASTDVLPRLQSIIDAVAAATEAIGVDPAELPVSGCVRVW